MAVCPCFALRWVAGSLGSCQPHGRCHVHMEDTGNCVLSATVFVADSSSWSEPQSHPERCVCQNRVACARPVPAPLLTPLQLAPALQHSAAAAARQRAGCDCLRAPGDLSPASWMSEMKHEGAASRLEACMHAGMPAGCFLARSGAAVRCL